MEELLQQSLEFFKNSSSLDGMAKVSAIVFLLVGFIKSSALSFLWDKLGNFKAFAVPTLTLIGAITHEFVASGKVSFSVAMLALGHSLGAMALADLFDALKKVKGLGKLQLTIIGLIEKILLKKKTTKKE